MANVLQTELVNYW